MDDISEAKGADYKQAFKLFDADGDGQINVSDLGNMMAALGEACSERDLQDMIAEVDVSGSGTIEFNEFLFIMARRQKDGSVDDVKSAFSVFDKGGNGVITADDMQRVLASLGEEVSPTEAAQIIKDISNADTVNIDQFRKMVR